MTLSTEARRLGAKRAHENMEGFPKAPKTLEASNAAWMELLGDKCFCNTGNCKCGKGNNAPVASNVVDFWALMQ